MSEWLEEHAWKAILARFTERHRFHLRPQLFSVISRAELPAFV